SYWPTFGQPLGADQQGPLTETDTTLGWSVSAPDLLLTSGTRTLTLSLTLKVTQEADLPNTSKLNNASVLSLFDMDITTAEAWQPLELSTEASSIKATSSENTLTVTLVLSFALDINHPATAPYNAEVHGPGYDSTWPIFRMQLTGQQSNDDESYGQRFYPILRLLKMSNLTIDTDAKDFQNFVMQNDDGAVDPTKPFLPFGAQPLKNSHWYLGGQELFCKPLQKVKMTVNWDELPLTKSYFRYYLSYNLHPLKQATADSDDKPQIAPYYLNQVFQAQAEVLKQGEWGSALPLSDTDLDLTYTGLFNNVLSNKADTPGTGDQTNGDNGKPLTPKEAFGKETALHEGPWTIEVNLAGQNAYNPDQPVIEEYKPGTVQGFMRMTLANPVQGFGKEDYPRVVNEVTNVNTARTMYAAVNNKPPTICSLENLLDTTSLDSESIAVAQPIKDAIKAAQDSLDSIDGFPDNTSRDALLADINTKIDAFSPTLDTKFADAKKPWTASIDSMIEKIDNYDEEESKAALTALQTSIDDYFETLNSDSKTWATGVYDDIESIITASVDAYVATLDLSGAGDNTDAPTSEGEGNANAGEGESTPTPEPYTIPDATKNEIIDKIETAYKNQLTTIQNRFTALVTAAQPTSNATMTDLKQDLTNLKSDIEGSSLSMDWSTLKNDIQTVVNSAWDKLRSDLAAISETLDTNVNKLIVLVREAYSSIICLEPQPATPLAPKAKNFTLEYQSTNTWSFENSNPEGIQLYHQGPWTTWQVADPQTATWLPYFGEEGYAYIGLAQTQLEQLLTLLLVVENPVQTLKSNTTTNQQIQYPSTDGTWKDLPLKEDGTSGLLQSGIIQFILPADTQPDFAQVAYPGEQPTIWLRIMPPSTKEGDVVTVDALHDIKVRLGYLATNATRVTNTLAGMPSLLPETITQTVVVMEELETITQPLTSLVGRADQTEAEFWQSTAWRLQNKGRASRLQDYESLALEEFPQLFQLAATNEYSDQPSPCTKNGTETVCWNTERKPRLVHMTVIPFTLTTSSDRYRPRATARLMLDTLNYLKPLTPPGQTIQVYNPLYAYLTVTAIIKFEDGDQPLGAIDALVAELMLFLSPWIKDNPYAGQQPKTWTKGVIYAFLKKQPKVKSVLNFETTIYLEDDPRKQLREELDPGSAAYLVVPSLTQKISILP
ncbi:MAG TPA: hypothetical protein DCR93_29240, partial [Cytophagales bacterium]|nr:hypothetical protein [Cytophagales bacterium]